MHKLTKITLILAATLTVIAYTADVRADTINNTTVNNTKVCVIPDAYAAFVITQVTTELTNRVKNNPLFSEYIKSKHLSSKKHSANIAKEVQSRLNKYCDSL